MDWLEFNQIKIIFKIIYYIGEAINNYKYDRLHNLNKLIYDQIYTKKTLYLISNVFYTFT